MRFRKLRIAWSVGWGLAAVLLCVRWVRTTHLIEAAEIEPFVGKRFVALSREGRLEFSIDIGVNKRPPMWVSFPLADASGPVMKASWKYGKYSLGGNNDILFCRALLVPRFGRRCCCVDFVAARPLHPPHSANRHNRLRWCSG